MRTTIIFALAAMSALTGCAGDAPGLSTFEVPGSHTDLGVAVTVSADGDCLVADHEGQRVGAAFPRGAERDGDTIRWGTSQSLKLGKPGMAGGVVVGDAVARAEYGLEPLPGCSAEQWLLVW